MKTSAKLINSNSMLASVCFYKVVILPLYPARMKLGQEEKQVHFLMTVLTLDPVWWLWEMLEFVLTYCFHGLNLHLCFQLQSLPLLPQILVFYLVEKLTKEALTFLCKYKL